MFDKGVECWYNSAFVGLLCLIGDSRKVCTPLQDWMAFLHRNTRNIMANKLRWQQCQQRSPEYPHLPSFFFSGAPLSANWQTMGAIIPHNRYLYLSEAGRGSEWVRRWGGDRLLGANADTQKVIRMLRERSARAVETVTTAHCYSFHWPRHLFPLLSEW